MINREDGSIILYQFILPLQKKPQPDLEPTSQPERKGTETSVMAQKLFFMIIRSKGRVVKKLKQPLSYPGRFMRLFGSIIGIPIRYMDDLRHHLAMGYTDYVWWKSVTLVSIHGPILAISAR